jgi:hypothetical protein
MAIGITKAEIADKVKTFQANKEAIKAIKAENDKIFSDIKALEKENDDIKALLLVSTENGKKAVYFPDIKQTAYFIQNEKAFTENRLYIVDGKQEKPDATKKPYMTKASTK